MLTNESWFVDSTRINIMTTEVRDLANHCIYLKNNALYNEVPLQTV